MSLNRSRRLLATLALVPLLALTGCQKTKAELLQQSGNVKTKQQLQTTLGTPDDIDKLAMFEKWTYKAKDGNVYFIIAGDEVTLQATENRDHD